VFLFLSVTASFSCTLKFIVKDCDPATGEPDDDEGYDDEYVVSVTTSSFPVKFQVARTP